MPGGDSEGGGSPTSRAAERAAEQLTAELIHEAAAEAGGAPPGTRARRWPPGAPA